MLFVRFPSDGGHWQVGGLIDVAEHRLGLQRPLAAGERVVAHCLDDVAWLMSLEEVEVGLHETRYLLRARRRVGIPTPRPTRGEPVSTAQTHRLLTLLAALEAQPPGEGPRDPRTLDRSEGGAWAAS